MIQRSPSLVRRLDRETERHVGSLGQLVYYDGVMPKDCDHPATGNKVLTLEPLPSLLLFNATRGLEPTLAPESTYWRVYDNGGICVMQGDGS